MRWRDAGDSGGGSAAGGGGTLDQASLYCLLKDILRPSATVHVEADDSRSTLTLSGRLEDAERRTLEGAVQVDGITLSGRDVVFASNGGDEENRTTSVRMAGITTADEGSDLGRLGTVEKLNFTGAGVKATRETDSNETTVNIRGVVDKIATYEFPVTTIPTRYDAVRTPIPGTWTVDSDDDERYSRTDDNNSLRIKRDLPDTLSGFRGVVKVDSVTVSTFFVPWTLVAAPTSTSSNTGVHVEQGYYMTIPHDDQDGYSVLLVVQRQAVNTHGDAIFFRGCNNYIPPGVTVELYEWIA